MELETEFLTIFTLQKKIEKGQTLSPFKIEIKKIPISNLVPHEGTIEWHIKETKDWLERDGFQRRPIAVSRLDKIGPKWRDKFLIHDGHHRTRALKELHCSYVMCSIFDFSDPQVKVFDYDTVSIPIPKEEVIRRAMSGIDPTPRFDKHFIDLNLSGKLLPFHDNSLVEPELPINLLELK